MKSKKSVKNSKTQSKSRKEKNKDSKSVKEIYQSSLDYLKKSKQFIWIAVGIFFFFFLLGLLVPAPETIQQQIFDLIRELTEKVKDLSGIELIFYIFFNNLSASLFGLVFGVFFGVFSIISSVSNGYVLGFVSALSISAEGVGSLWKILPHGIFELPAIFISLGLGLSLGFPFVYRYFKYYFNKNNGLAVIFGILFLLPAVIITSWIDKKLRDYQFRDFKYRFNHALSVFFFVVVPLLIIAAIIEGLLISFL